MPNRSSRRGRLRDARLTDHYGSRAWDITYTVEEAPGEVRRASVGVESVYDNPRPGDVILVTFINGKATAVYSTD